jgi:class 3 adenylate cyclase
MDIYNDYLNLIKEAVNSDPSNYISKGLGSPYQSRSDVHFKSLLSKIKGNEIAASMLTLSENLGTSVDYDQQLGKHPNFKHLKETNGTEEHYIVSAFMDIKGSTNLFKKFNKETIYLITNAILKAGIHTVLIFGGYVHRLQGDGIFAYFGDRSMSEEEAVEMSLKAVSVYTHFVKNDLKEYFESQGIENIAIRSGIDLGHRKDVLWGNSGIGEISEITTCSLHTSLASKMQSSAMKNGVVVGENIKQQLVNGDDFFKPVSARTGSENDRYIYRINERNFYYTQYDFKWEKFLKLQDFIAIDQYGNPVIKIKNKAKPLSIASLEPIASLNKPYFSNDQYKIR